MEIAVIGGGHGAYAAADLGERGHKVRLWRRDGEAPVLARGERIEIVRKGKVVEPNRFKGIVRLRPPPPAERTRPGQTED